MNRDDADWERLARRDPYWAVLTNARFRAAAMSRNDRDAFFAEGERHVEAVFATCETWRPAPWTPRRALDFGCGVGRLLPALARRCEQVVGADVAAAMLGEATANCRRLALSNVALVRSEDDLGRCGGGFDLVHSLIVFQHIRPERGERIAALLCDQLAAGGIAVLHFTTGAPVATGSRRLAQLRLASRPFNAVANLIEGRHPGEPPIRMYSYDPSRLRKIVAARGCVLLEAQALAVPGHDGVLLYVEKPPI